MKKLIALALCLMLAVCSAVVFAESATETNTVSASLGSNVYTWNVPEGYEASAVTSSDGSLYVYFMPMDVTGPMITCRMVMTDTEEGLTEKAVSDLTREQQDALIAALLEEMDFADPVVEFSESANGISVITMNENSDECDYASMLFVVNNCMAEISVWHNDMSVVTEADTAAALAIIESMTVTEGTETAVNQVDGLTVLYEAPEGYSVSYDKYDDGALLVYLTPTEESKPTYAVLVSKDETVADGTRLNDLSEEDKAAFLAYISENYNDPTVTTAVTGEGTEVFILNENGCETDYAEISTIYEGHGVCMAIMKDDGSEITEEDIQLGLDICTRAIISADAK